jgi:hypothetical protein
MSSRPADQNNTQLHPQSFLVKNRFRSNRAEMPWAIGIIGITLAGMALRLIYQNQPVGFDEAYTYLAYSSQSFFHILTDYSYPNNHIFHSLLVALSTRLFNSSSAWAVRLPVFIVGTALIPVTYLAGRKIYSSAAGLIAAALVAAGPLFINYSAEARGYSLICLFSTLMVWLAARFVERPTKMDWIAFTLCGILGGYTIPIMLYPLACIYVWLVLELLVRGGFTRSTLKSIGWVVLDAVIVLAGVILTYLPVAVFGTGFHSVFANGYVSPEAAGDFIPNLTSRLSLTWKTWNNHLPLVLTFLTAAGFLLSLAFHLKTSRYRVHLAVASLVLIPILLIQKVAPLWRVWQFMQGWYYLWAGAGLAGLFALIKTEKFAWVKGFLIWLMVIYPLADRTAWIFGHDYPDITQSGVNEDVARMLNSQVRDGDLIVSVLPMNTQIKFYFHQLADDQRWFYNTKHKPAFNQALVVVDPRAGDTLASVLTQNDLEDRVDIQAAAVTGTVGKVQIYRVPSIPHP